VDCFGVDRSVMNSHGAGTDVYTLEAYAQAVRLYQQVVLELQDTTSNNPEVLGAVLQKAEAAKERVNRYRTPQYGR
jgi:CHASE3 domain sensor protein